MFLAPFSDRVLGWRGDTPGCEERVHLNNAGASLQPRAVLEAVNHHLQREAQIGGYEAAAEAADAIRQCYTDLARLLGTKARNVAFVENATVAISQALSAFDLHRGDRIVTTQVDYPSNQIMYLALARRLRVEVMRAGDLPEGGVDPENVRELARDPRCRLVALTWVPTNSGLIQNAQKVGEICQELGVPYIVDACQVVGQLPVDVGDLRCDFLAGTARKFLRGPRGIGFLYVSDQALERGDYPLYVDMHGAEWTQANDFRLADGAQRFENWEFSFALVLGLGAAARYALQAGPDGSIRTQALAAALRERLGAIADVSILDRGAERSAIVTVSIAGWNAGDLVLRLREQRINTSASPRESGVIDMDAKRVTSALRFSAHYYNTEEELDLAAVTLERVIHV